MPSLISDEKTSIHCQNLVKSFISFVMFTTCFWSQTSKRAKRGNRTVCAFDRSTIPHSHFLDRQDSLRFRRKKTCSVDLQGKGVTLGMNFWTTPRSFPKPLMKKMTNKDDSRFHLLVSESSRNRFLTINAAFYMKSTTVLWYRPMG